MTPNRPVRNPAPSAEETRAARLKERGLSSPYIESILKKRKEQK